MRFKESVQYFVVLKSPRLTCHTEKGESGPMSYPTSCPLLVEPPTEEWTDDRPGKRRVGGQGLILLLGIGKKKGFVLNCDSRNQRETSKNTFNNTQTCLPYYGIMSPSARHT